MIYSVIVNKNQNVLRFKNFRRDGFIWWNCVWITSTSI